MTADPSFLSRGKAAARCMPGAPSACGWGWALTLPGPFLHPPQVTARLCLCNSRGRELRDAVCASRDAGSEPADVANPPQLAGPASERRREPWPEPGGAPSSFGDPPPDALFLGRQDGFSAFFSHDNIFLHSQTRLHCVSGALTAPGCRFVSEL